MDAAHIGPMMSARPAEATHEERAYRVRLSRMLLTGTAVVALFIVVGAVRGRTTETNATRAFPAFDLETLDGRRLPHELGAAP